jgi:hypothetical protein
MIRLLDAFAMPDQDLLMSWINGKTATARRQRAAR